MTLSKLAQLANVSLAVVSKAFSGRDDVSESMREHVFAVAKEHGCFQQFYHARYDKPVIAVIIPEAISKYYIHYIETLKKDIEENGYTMLLSISNFDAQLTEELVRYYAEHSKVDGIILVDSKLKYSFDYTTAIIFITHPKELISGTYIKRSLDNGVRECIEYLHSNGHRKIAYIGEPLTKSKEASLVSEMKRLGIEVKKEWFISSRMRFEDAGMDGVERILSSSDEKPTVIIGAYGYITQGILTKLAQMGLSVPDEISVISMDNDPFPIHPTLDVSCIPSGIDDICAGAMKQLHEKIRTEHPNTPPAFIEIKSEFHVGNTVKKI